LRMPAISGILVLWAQDSVARSLHAFFQFPFPARGDGFDCCQRPV
jgi:hypothetical protein